MLFNLGMIVVWIVAWRILAFIILFLKSLNKSLKIKPCFGKKTNNNDNLNFDLIFNDSQDPVLIVTKKEKKTRL